ncbi:MAG: hypothetical protein ACOYM0_14370 [Bacteroidales bacterium]
MRNSAYIRYFFFSCSVICLAAFTSCKHGAKTSEVKTENFIVRDFLPATNWDLKKVLNLDYDGAMQGGFLIPTVRQTGDGFFDLEFSIKNTAAEPQKFAYKIYYQNESYKFPERDASDSARQGENAWENFYGSWEDTLSGFRETEVIANDNSFHKVTSQVRIVGNPRNEKLYFNGPWNDRWKRNPRVGEYSFMLVVTTPATISQKLIPDFVQYINQRNNGEFVNPYFFFLYGLGSKLSNTMVSVAPSRLKVMASPDPGAGIYIHPVHFKKEFVDKYATSCCGQDEKLFQKAAFGQFIHFIDASTKLKNIPVIEDVLGDNYSKMDYNWNSRFYRNEELIAATSLTAPEPCQTVVSDPVNKKITMFNPKAEFGKWQKQNVGVITRHPFTYGKWTVKCKLTELLNRNNMWNGLTNAVWLITQDQAEWNFRRECKKGGYMANYYGGQQDVRIKQVGYSEIDFEILKTVPYCPQWLLPPAYNNGLEKQYDVPAWNVPFPEEVMADDDKITVSCTNWDMACWDPSKFKDGCQTIDYQGQTFWAHRWDKNYRAITEKTPEPDDELFASPYYYFQIDWRPAEIIWRIGKSKDKLRVVGYVNSTMTCIPNNEMLLIVTQEFHNTKWWVGSQYLQENIPFPGKNITGEIYEVTIE